MDKDALKHLDSFTGTENYYKLPLFRGVVYTDGVRHLALNADAYWLLDAIASHQPRALKDKSLRQIQFWRLEPLGDNQAKLSCDRDEGDEAFHQIIPFTDFPFDAVPRPRVWVAPSETQDGPVMVAYLPSEH